MYIINILTLDWHYKLNDMAEKNFTHHKEYAAGILGNRAYTEEITPYDMATMSVNVYGEEQGPLPGNWQLLENKSSINGYQGQVYINEVTQEIVVAHRGTEMTKPNDLLTDVGYFADDKLPNWITNNVPSELLIFGTQINTGLNWTNELVEKYPNYNFRHTGHSLGGFLAESIGRFHGQKVTSFDPLGSDYIQQHVNAKELMSYDPSRIERYGSETGIDSKIVQGANAQYGKINYVPSHGHKMDGIKNQFNPLTGDLNTNDHKYANQSIVYDGVNKSSALNSMISGWK